MAHRVIIRAAELELEYNAAAETGDKPMLAYISDQLSLAYEEIEALFFNGDEPDYITNDHIAYSIMIEQWKLEGRY